MREEEERIYNKEGQRKLQLIVRHKVDGREV